MFKVHAYIVEPAFIEKWPRKGVINPKRPIMSVERGFDFETVVGVATAELTVADNFRIIHLMFYQHKIGRVRGPRVQTYTGSSKNKGYGGSLEIHFGSKLRPSGS